MKRPLRNTLARWWRDWLKSLLMTAVLLGAFRSACADWNDVPTGSMQPTVLVGDRVFVNKLAYDLKVPFSTWRISEWAQPERGDVVVLYSPANGRRLLKRVVALPGDRLEVRNHRLILNGTATSYDPVGNTPAQGDLVSVPPEAVPLEEHLDRHDHPVFVDSSGGMGAFFGPIVVPRGEYFVMGDCRDNSFDSRFFGPVARSAILGRATAVVLSLDYGHPLEPRWSRFFTALP